MSDGRPPRWIDRINFAWKYLFNTCELPFMLYFELGREPAGRAALSLLSFGMDDLIRSYFRPAGLRTKRHGRKGRKNKKRPGIPETSDLIAERLPGHQEVKGRKVSDGVRLLWKVDAIIQRGLYYFMLADVIGDFAYDWTTAIIRHDNSVCPNTYRRLNETKNLTIANTNGAFGPMLYGDTRYVQGPISRFGSVWTVGEGYYQVIANVTIRNSGPFNRETEVQLRLRNLTKKDDDYSGRYKLQLNQTADCIAALTLHGPASFAVEICNDGQFGVVTEGECFVFGYPSYG